MKTLYLILLCLLGSSALSSAQTAGTWHHFVASTPRAMIGDGRFLWVATDGGLVKFNRDLGTFELISSDNSGLPANALYGLMIDRQHALWVSAQSMSGGLARLQDGKWTVFDHNNSPLPPPGNGACIPVCDSLGRIWVGTSIGLLEYKGGTWTKYDTANAPLCTSSISALTADHVGNIWIGCPYVFATKDRGRILKFDGTSKWEVHNDTLDGNWNGDTLVSPQIYPGTPWSMVVDADDNLFVGFPDVVQNIIPIAQRPKPDWFWGTYHVTPGFQYSAPNYVLSLSQVGGYIWASNMVTTVRLNDTLGPGHVAQAEYSPYNSKFPFYGSSAVVGDDSELWFCGNGYFGSGIARYKDSAWTSYPNLSNNALTANQLEKATGDSKGRVWFSQGVNHPQLSCFDGKVWQNFDTVLHGVAARSLCADSSGNVWLGTGGHGVIKFDGLHEQYYDLHTLANLSDEVIALAFDKRGILWVGTQLENDRKFASGLAKFDGTNWTSYTPSNTPLSESEINSLAVDTAGLLWIGNLSYGLATSDDTGHWTHINPSNSAFPSLVAASIIAAPNGDVWVTTDMGASRWDGKSWTTYTSGPLPDLTGCAVDARGHVWFSSYNSSPDGAGGACEFDGTTWTNYTPDNSPIGSKWEWTVIADRSGNLWFPTDGQGVVEYTPGSLAAVTPLARIESQSLVSYPNPASATVRCLADGIGEAPAMVTILDLLGRTVMSTNVANASDFLLDTRSLPSGVYTIISKSESQITRGQFVVAR